MYVDIIIIYFKIYAGVKCHKLQGRGVKVTTAIKNITSKRRDHIHALKSP